jgi:hypothetical protein
MAEPRACLGEIMRVLMRAIIVTLVLAAPPLGAQSDAADAQAFWKSVQAKCDATAAQPASQVGRRIAQAAIDEFNFFGGHEIDANGRLLRFGVTAAEPENDSEGPASNSQHSWRRVMTYWRSLYGDDFGPMLEVRGRRDAADAGPEKPAGALLDATPAALSKAVEGVADPGLREILRETVLRAAVLDTPWSAAFISYVVKEAGVSAGAFQFSNAHRAYIYDAFAASAAELSGNPGERLYRACPLSATKPRAGDLICNHREPALADADEQTVREHIRAEADGKPDVWSVRRTHCEVAAFVDGPASKMYSIGGNVLHGVAARKLNLRQPGLKFSSAQAGDCSDSNHWALPPSAANERPNLTDQCSLNDRNWFVLLQMR